MTITEIMVWLLVISLVPLTYILAYPTKLRVERLLRRHNIYPRQFRGFNPHTMESLVDCIHSGAGWLESCINGQLLLHLNIAVVTVRCNRSGYWEELRVCRNGTQGQPDGGLSKIIKLSDEDPVDVARKMLAERLGKTETMFISRGFCTLEKCGLEITQPQQSHLFPRLHDVHHNYLFVCTIGPIMYHNKYVHEEDGRQTYFRWERVGNN